MQIEMEKADWIALSEFIEAANEAKAAIEQAADEGKQQVSVRYEAIDRFMQAKVPPKVWIKLGALVGERLKHDE
jgi:hypothetical protein